MAGFDVDTGALRQWAQLVDRQRGYLDQVRNERAALIADADFGVIMDLISGPYSDLLPKVDAGLDAAVTSLGRDVTALQATAVDYDDGDGRTRTGSTARTGAADMTGFADVTTPAFSCPGPALGPLPEVSFGGVLNAVDSAIEWVTGTSLRREVTDLLVGDTQKLSMQVEEWKVLATALDAIEANLASGLTEIGTTWTGEAEQAMASYFGQWGQLPDPAGRDHALDRGRPRRHGPQRPGHGTDRLRPRPHHHRRGSAPGSRARRSRSSASGKLIKSVKEAVVMVYRAIQVIKVFHDLITLVKDGIVLAYDAFETDEVPSSAGAAAPRNAA